MKVILFYKMFKIECKFRNFQKNMEKVFFVSEILASENIAINCLY